MGREIIARDPRVNNIWGSWADCELEMSHQEMGPSGPKHWSIVCSSSLTKLERD